MDDLQLEEFTQTRGEGGLPCPAGSDHEHLPHAHYRSLGLSRSNPPIFPIKGNIQSPALQIVCCNQQRIHAKHYREAAIIVSVTAFEKQLITLQRKNSI